MVYVSEVRPPCRLFGCTGGGGRGGEDLVLAAFQRAILRSDLNFANSTVPPI